MYDIFYANVVDSSDNSTDSSDSTSSDVIVDDVPINQTQIDYSEKLDLLILELQEQKENDFQYANQFVNSLYLISFILVVILLYNFLKELFYE